MRDELEELRGLRFMPSRIPAQDALEGFVPTGQTPDSEVQAILDEGWASRWYPIDGGHRLLVLYDGGPYSADHFTLRPGAWDHEHCSHCGASIAPMTLCWVTETGEYVLLDDQCYQLLLDTGPAV